MSVPLYNITDIEKAPPCQLGALGVTDIFAYPDNYTDIIEFYIIINIEEYGYECMNLLTGETIWFAGCDEVKRVKEYSLDFGERYRSVQTEKKEFCNYP